ncbi:chemotaxis protein CheW [Clostridium butyricum]|uniref:Chemotaxis protein CheW n=1 Tax=Clostridium butyricum E4 str. BoNT E BL5262 TaxID=632245 RepID=C4IDR6_CLOBU|nr:chemotaxis protein CheW [Clostridium butyricum]APF23423.1 cheW-like domain protein [Clostridium butyricum]EDT75254.1 chemotaxis protein CheW [Clostridium butyricum 5521]EEP55082.1 chemotaxis protein CheW [Clostridium butyricum E4 str. BoNT E BL5262]NFL31574.1 purine-binding chemotaxis protein CheW [Clostridium butyricum]NFS18159.1 purine-binding chemotaxis protein CheW [Clostridium butyricum]
MALDNRKIIIFELNKECYAADIKEVERILGYEEPTVLPEAPHFVKGVINHEEKILPIISLSKKFNIGEGTNYESKKIVVVKRKEKKFGIIVDNVYEVRDIDGGCVENAPEITNTSERRYISGLIKLKNNIVILLDLEKILSIEDEDSIF